MYRSIYIYTYIRLVYRTAKSEACQRTRQDDNLKPLLPSAISQWNRISYVFSKVGIVKEEMFSKISKNILKEHVTYSLTRKNVYFGTFEVKGSILKIILNCFWNVKLSKIFKTNAYQRRSYRQLRSGKIMAKCASIFNFKSVLIRLTHRAKLVNPFRGLACVHDLDQLRLHF